MKPFIFDARNGIHIIDLSKTLNQLEAACNYLAAAVSKGARVLFVGTKNIGESADRVEDRHGNWADGLNIISQDNGGVNVEQGEIFSLHSDGACSARADGGVIFIAKSTDPYVVGALCTRNGGEVVNLSSF